MNIRKTARRRARGMTAAGRRLTQPPLRRGASAERTGPPPCRDGLTTLATLAAFLSDHGAAGRRLGVIFINLDGFALINNTRGYRVGDEVLDEVTRRLCDVLESDETISTFGGDEFIIATADRYAGSPRAPHRAREVAQQVMDAVALPIPTSSGLIHITASVGVSDTGAVIPDDPLEIVRRADHAMRIAKRRGRARWATYTSELHRENREHQEIEALLQNALAEGRLTAHYQPIARLATGVTASVEVLLRMKDRDGALIEPDRFIPVAERSGLIVPIGAWVLAESCREIARLRRTATPDLRVAVNMSARQAARPDLVTVVTEALRAAELPADALVLELTESALLEAEPGTLQRLSVLRERGIGIALDDFGTGYSSLTYLRQLPVSRVKIDRSFVAGITEQDSDAVIVRAVTGLVENLGMDWVAEGIESPEQWALLHEFGDGFGQGYVFAKPMTVHELEQHLRTAPPVPHLVGTLPRVSEEVLPCP